MPSRYLAVASTPVIIIPMSEVACLSMSRLQPSYLAKPGGTSCLSAL